MRISLILGVLVFIFSFSITNSVYAISKENNLNAQEKRTENRQVRVADTTDTEDNSDLEGKQKREVKAKENRGNEDAEENKSSMGEQRRSQVANAVQEMLQIADRNGGIGEQVRIIAQSQKQNHEVVEEEIEKIKNRSNFAKFFIGPKYDKIEKAKELLKLDKEKISELEELKASITNVADNAKITEQIEITKKAMTEVENIVGEEKGGFSLFGWLSKIF